jgi:hypothetical protein
MGLTDPRVEPALPREVSASPHEAVPVAHCPIDPRATTTRRTWSPDDGLRKYLFAVLHIQVKCARLC